MEVSRGIPSEAGASRVAVSGAEASESRPVSEVATKVERNKSREERKRVKRAGAALRREQGTHRLVRFRLLPAFFHSLSYAGSLRSHVFFID
jgi:hypothetical protein